MPIGIVCNVLRGSAIEGHANMKDLLWVTIPYMGRVYMQSDAITRMRISWEELEGPRNTKEYLLCLGRLRVYFTPASLVAAEGHLAY